MRVIISGGGTGGHIFPAIAIANELKKRNPETEILFVGAQDRMEMKKVPEAGYTIEGLWISGIQRRFSAKNLLLPFKWIHSIRKAAKIIARFKPDIVIGVGGYASAAVLYVAANRNIPTLIQEQNSYAGITNKFLGKRVNAICVAYSGMEKFFPAHKIKITGNPIREDILHSPYSQEEARKALNLPQNKTIVLITGGSLGARTINQAVAQSLESLAQDQLVLYWQTGSFYYPQYASFQKEGVHVCEFIKDMGQAYKAADLVVCRAGALTLAELCAIGKPAILIPSPFVAEDHQTHNAMQLVNQHAALMIKDNEAIEKLADTLQTLANNPMQLQSLGTNALAMGYPNATQKIVDEIEMLAQA